MWGPILAEDRGAAATLGVVAALAAEALAGLVVSVEAAASAAEAPAEGSDPPLQKTKRENVWGNLAFYLSRCGRTCRSKGVNRSSYVKLVSKVS